VLLISLSAIFGCSEAPVTQVETFTEPAQGWTEVWRDDFDGAMGDAPDASKWNVELRPSGYNGEQDYDTNERENSFLDGEGHLVIQALRKNYVDASGSVSTQPYTSARLNTQGKLEQTYGKFEARIRLPPGGKGIWPAFWLLGANIADGWPECGEVDILEMRGSAANKVVSSLHGPGYSGDRSYHKDSVLTAGNYGDAFHTFTFEWTQEAVRWLIDGQPFFVKTADALRGDAHRWVYDHPFFIILNLAVGGIFDGEPAATTVFPQQMVVDYVSVSVPAGASTSP
jgi:beta-glucanase (GH16 family)